MNCVPSLPATLTPLPPPPPLIPGILTLPGNSIRRTLFSHQQRTEFLTSLMRGICSILRDSRGLKDADNYHEFCRLLARVKTNFQLNELVSVHSYDEFINGVAQFTVLSFLNWDWASNRSFISPPSHINLISGTQTQHPRGSNRSPSPIEQPSLSAGALGADGDFLILFQVGQQAP